ncbi:MAG: hypothetical protein ACR2I8_00720 [Steroidobacteraceae bacterium]
MIRICPSCRAPTNVAEIQCWVCHRVFDGSEPLIGDVPEARAPLRHAPEPQALRPQSLMEMRSARTG